MGATRLCLHDLADDGTIGLSSLDGATLIDGHESLKQFGERRSLALMIYTLQLAYPFTVTSLGNFAIGCAQ